MVRVMARITIEVVTDNPDASAAVRDLMVSVHQHAEADDGQYYDTTTTMQVDGTVVERFSTDASASNAWLDQVQADSTGHPFPLSA